MSVARATFAAAHFEKTRRLDYTDCVKKGRRTVTVGVSLTAARNVFLVENPSEPTASITLPRCQRCQQLN